MLLAQYRRKEILETLRKPLDDNENEDSNIEAKNSLKENPLFYISNNNKNDLKDFRKLNFDSYLNEEKMRIFMDPKYKSILLRTYLRDYFQSTESRGKFLLGLQNSTLDWLLYNFSQISQNTKYFNMHQSVNKLLNKLF